MSVDDVVNGMGLLQARLVANRHNFKYRETVEPFYQEHTDWLAAHGAADRAAAYNDWLEKFRRVYPMPAKAVLQWMDRP